MTRTYPNWPEWHAFGVGFQPAMCVGALMVFYSLPDGNLALAATKIFASFMCKQVSRQGHLITNVV